MIVVKELRIGNIIWSCMGGEEDIVEADDFEMIADDFGGYEPIPLTEEWLIKFGLVGKKQNEFYTHITKLTGGNIEIDYVHQLQNLYFALTGEELTLSE